MSVSNFEPAIRSSSYFFYSIITSLSHRECYRMSWEKGCGWEPFASLLAHSLSQGGWSFLKAASFLMCEQPCWRYGIQFSHWQSYTHAITLRETDVRSWRRVVSFQALCLQSLVIIFFHSISQHSFPFIAIYQLKDSFNWHSSTSRSLLDKSSNSN